MHIYYRQANCLNEQIRRKQKGPPFGSPLFSV